MTPQEQAERGHRAAAAMDEFFEPAMQVARDTYMTALTKLAASEPWETGKISRLAIAVNVIDIVSAHLTAIVNNGQAAIKTMQHTAQIENLPDRKKRGLFGV